jgi:polysaccharide pyruvyl transferase WcaK-like protein
MPKMSDSKRKDTAVYCYGSYGHGNMGDELIASGLANVVKSIFDCHSTLIVDNESKYHRANPSHRIMWDEIVDPAKGRRGIVREVSLMVWLFFHLKKDDAFILGGGGLLNDCHTYNMPHFFLLLLMARLKTSEVFLLGISVGPINGRVSRTLFSLLMKLIKVAYVRDVASVLAGQKVCGAPVEICRDLAWFAGYFNGANTNPLSAVSKEIVCGINVIPYFHQNHWFEVDQDVYQDYLVFMTEVIALLRQEGVKLVLFSVDCNRDPVAMDDLISRAGAVEFFSVSKSPSQLVATVRVM